MVHAEPALADAALANAAQIRGNVAVVQHGGGCTSARNETSPGSGDGAYEHEGVRGTRAVAVGGW